PTSCQRPAPRAWAASGGGSPPFSKSRTRATPEGCPHQTRSVVALITRCPRLLPHRRPTRVVRFQFVSRALVLETSLRRQRVDPTSTLGVDARAVIARTSDPLE